MRIRLTVVTLVAAAAIAVPGLARSAAPAITPVTAEIPPDTEIGRAHV